MKHYLEWASRGYSLRRRLFVLLLAAILFLLILPSLLIACAAMLDSWLQLGRFSAGLLNPVVGAILILSGVIVALWSIAVQVDTGSGTPLPMMPTQRLIVKPPFSYCRNPMTLGTIVGYIGIGVVLGSATAIAIVLLFGALLLAYLRFVEEKELEARFGADYLEYRRTTPFLLPRPRRRHEAVPPRK